MLLIFLQLTEDVQENTTQAEPERISVLCRVLYANPHLIICDSPGDTDEMSRAARALEMPT